MKNDFLKNNSEYNWNPVFKLIMEIKAEYIKKFGKISCYDIIIKEDSKKEITCLENWVEQLDNQEWNNIFSFLQINQKDTMVLIRYGNYCDVFGGEQEITNDTFWNMYDGIYKECRSLVIDLKNEIIVLSPFKKFQNVGEIEANSIENITKEIQNAKSVEITDKLDGSMQSYRFVPEYESVTMSGSQAINMSNSWRLQDGYSMLISNENYFNMVKTYWEYTFIFEYISLKDAHVVCYTAEQEGLYLIGMRNVYTGSQLSYKEVIDIANEYNVKTTTLFNKTFDEVLADTKIYKSNEKEGYVINIDGRLVKIKVEDYLQIHKVLSKISSINLIIKSIADDQYDDLIAKIPNSYRDRVEKISKLVFKYSKDMNRTVEEYYSQAPKTDRKEFMLWVDKNVLKRYVGYVKNCYFGYKNNYIKSGNEKAPKYIKLNEIIGNNNYTKAFEED
jgi:hypothetical protein